MRNRLLIMLAVMMLSALLRWFAQNPEMSPKTLLHPFRALIGSSQELNAKLIEVSESSDSIRSAGRRLLQPFGAVRLIHIYDAPEPETTKKN